MRIIMSIWKNRDVIRAVIHLAVAVVLAIVRAVYLG